MLKDIWTSKLLKYSSFLLSEAVEAKRIFDANHNLIDCDPIFDIYPLQEFIDLIGRDCTHVDPTDKSMFSMFFIRKITDFDNNILGYFQVEINAPVTGECWLPMLVFNSEGQSSGYGKEVVESLITELAKFPALKSIGLNVYAENPRALRFWYRNGFDSIVGIDAESARGKNYNCITLKRNLQNR